MDASTSISNSGMSIDVMCIISASVLILCNNVIGWLCTTHVTRCIGINFILAISATACYVLCRI